MKRAGMGSHESAAAETTTWLTPPHMKSMMQFFALRGSGAALTTNGSTLAAAPLASRAMRLVRASPPKPWNIRPRNSRRLEPDPWNHSSPWYGLLDIDKLVGIEQHATNCGQRIAAIRTRFHQRLHSFGFIGRRLATERDLEGQLDLGRC